MRFKISSAVESVGDAVAGRKFSKIYIDHTVGSKKTQRPTERLRFSADSIFYVRRLKPTVYLSESSCPLQRRYSCPGRSVPLGAWSRRGKKVLTRCGRDSDWQVVFHVLLTVSRGASILYYADYNDAAGES